MQAVGDNDRQHAIMALGLLAYTLALARAGNLTVDQTRDLLAACAPGGPSQPT